MRTVIFLVLLAGAGGFFLRTVSRMVRAAARGAPDPRPRLDQLGKRIESVLVFFLGQKSVVAHRDPKQSRLRWSYHHVIIFWGFMVITLASIEILISGLFPSITLENLLPAFLHEPLWVMIDVFNLLVLTMVGWAFFRRIVLKPALIPLNLDAALILGAIGSLMVTHFLFHGFELAPLALQGELPMYKPVSGLVARLFAGVPAGTAHAGAEAGYWLHVLILLTFLNYLPYSKHIHLLGAFPNIFTRNLSERRLDLPKIDLEDEKQWGVGRYEQFSWKSLLDTYACTECARCTNNCPAYATGKNLSPMQLIHDIRYEMLDRDAILAERAGLEAQIAAFEVKSDDHGHKPPDLLHMEEQLAAVNQRIEDMPPMVGGRIADETLWACTTCGACQAVCPVFIEHPLKIIQMRQNLVLEQERVPGELGRAYRNIERQSNPWGIAADKRMDWAEGMDVPTIEDKPNPEYILWVGCAGAFDNRIIKQTKAMIQILDAANVDYAVLGHQEGCTGDPARRSGNEMLFQMQAEANIEVLNEAKAKKVITSCPHCLHTLRHDYPQFGGNYEVIHHTKLIAHLMQSGALSARANGSDGAAGKEIRRITYHDSCYMGRWNQEFEAPRQILEALPISGGVTELERSRMHGFCCGAGGARMFMEEHEPRVNVNRSDEIIAAGVDAVAVGCPFCNIMLTDGMKHRNKEEEIQVLDVAEVVAKTLIPAGSLVRRKQDEAREEA